MAIKDLVVNSKEIEEAALEGIVRKYFKYDQTGAVLFINRAYWKLPGDKKVALFLAALLGRKFIGVDNVETSASNDEIEKKLNMKGSSVRVYISQLRKSGSVTTDKDKHMVTTQGIHDLMEEDKMDDDPLQSLVVNETAREDRARAMLAFILKPYIEISEQPGPLGLLPQIYGLPPKEQILIILCGRLAQKYLNKLPEAQDEKLTQTEIMGILPTIPEGTVKTSLWWLRDKKFILNVDRKNFVTPGHYRKFKIDLQKCHSQEVNEGL